MTELTPKNSAPGHARLKEAFKQPYPWLTWILSALCILVWLGVQSEGAIANWDQMGRWGYYAYPAILGGKFWGLLTANFFHQDFLHLLFNLFWMLLLGSKVERSSGRKLLLSLVLGACLISTGSEILVSGQSGIGLSGVVYALVGFVLICSRKLSDYHLYLSRNDYFWLILWLIACVVATQAGLIKIANAAHVGGLVWGCLFATAFVTKEWRLPTRLGLTLLVGASLLPLVWMPWSADWLVYRGIQAYHRKDKTQAEYYLSRAVENKTNSAPAYLFLAMIYDGQNLDDKALDYYLKSEALKPGYLAEAQIVKLYLEKAKFDQAKAVAQKALKHKPGDVMMSQGIAFVEIEKKRWHEAKAILERALVKEPDNPVSLYLLGQIEGELGNDLASENYYQRMLDLDTHNLQAESGLIRLLIARQQWGRAEQKTLDVLKRYPDNPKLLMLLGGIYLDQNQTAKGIEIFTRLMDLPSVSPDLLSMAHYNLACGLARQHKQTEALAHLKQAIALNPLLKSDALKDLDFNVYQNLPLFRQLTD